MPIRPEQIAAAEALQKKAAQDPAATVRTIAGPGTGKSRSIEERVDWLLAEEVNPTHIRVISFTRATTAELRPRVARLCASRGRGPLAAVIPITTMHSLALAALSKAHLLARFPAHPMILDDWEQKTIFDAEFVLLAKCTPSRAKEIRLAYDAFWQTLDAVHLKDITPAETKAFEACHSSRTTHYSCLLAGEVVRECVNHMRAETLDVTKLLEIEQLIVDEFQDLNACDQEFIQRIHGAGSTLWIAGDDDQSIYSFRHADPSGLLNFPKNYPASSTHILNDCFCCTPAVLAAATSLVSINPARIKKA